MALNVDWPLAQSLFQEGVSLKGVAARTGIPYQTVVKRAQRGKWSQLVLPHPPVPSPSRDELPKQRSLARSTTRLNEKAENWTQRIENVLDRHLSVIEDTSGQRGQKLDIDVLEKLVRVLDATDRTARRTLGMDNGNHSTVTLQVQSELPAQRQLEDRNEVLEVETVPNVDTPPTDSVK